MKNPTDERRIPTDLIGYRGNILDRYPKTGRGSEGIAFSSVPLISYEYDPELGRDESIIATVKTTLQIHKNDREEEQQKRPRADVFGRERARRYVYGLVAAISLSHVRFNWNLKEAEWAFSALEPYAIDAFGNKMALANGSSVRLIDLTTAKETSCDHPWLSQVHSVQFSPDGRRLLAASSGFDAAIEFDTRSGKAIWEWFAWDHGYDRSRLGHYVVRFPDRSKTLAAIGREVILVDDPLNFEYGIATRLIPAHLNSARYGVDGQILVSLFHQGKGLAIDRMTAKAREVVSGLVNPHKLSSRRQGGYFISDTRNGKLVFMDHAYRRTREITLGGLPGVERGHFLSEFLQNTTELRDQLFACVDIHRNSLWLIDVKRRKYRGVKFPKEWSVHDIVSLQKEHRRQIGRLVGKTFGKVEAGEDENGKRIRHFAPDGREIVNLELDERSRARELDVIM
jgi:hypothetical protein